MFTRVAERPGSEAAAEASLEDVMPSLLETVAERKLVSLCMKRAQAQEEQRPTPFSA